MTQLFYYRGVNFYKLMQQTKFQKYFVRQSNNSEKIYNYRVLDVLSGGTLTEVLSDISSERA